jgi:mannosyl-3-phosphoglycerate phosphatase
VIPKSPFVIIFTDLDGTLLDPHTYKWKDARVALNKCKNSNIPIVLISSKTRAEIDVIRREMSLSAPFVSENGGGIFFPDGLSHDPPKESIHDNGMKKWALGIPYPQLVKGLREIRKELGWQIKGFSDMSIDEIANITGLDRKAARLAAMREFDEPFVILEKKPPDNNALSEAARKRGFTVIIGGRFYHLQGTNDKGMAMEKIVSWYRELHANVVSVALGDSPNDFSMFEKADYPVLVKSQRDFPELQKRVPHLKVTIEQGPKGWNSAVSDILQKLLRSTDN